MAPITVTTDVDRPPADTFAYVTDPTRFVEWQHNVTGGHMDGDGPHGVGARCLTTRRIGFAKRPITSEITHVDPPLDDGRRSRVTIALDFEGHGIGKLLVPLIVRRDAAKEMPDNIGRLKARLEEQHR